MLNIYTMNIQLFAEFTPHVTPGTPTVNPVNLTTTEGLSPAMRDFYVKALLENAREDIIYEQFGLKTPVKGNKAVWRKMDTIGKAITPLEEGVIPAGKNLGMTSLEATVSQHGDYAAVSDRLHYESFDPIIYQATEEFSHAMASTYDTLIRNVLVGGNTVMYAPIVDAEGKETEVNSRTAITNAAILTPKMVKKAATWLKKNKAPKIDGYYVAIIHPSVAMDLTESKEWKEFHKYSDAVTIFKGEIGMLHGVRFIESTEAKVYKSTKTVYVTLFLGKEAFGIVDPEGEGQEIIVKTEQQIGGPLNQFSTIGYKFTMGAKILYQERLLRVESGSSLGDDDEEN
jgi:N4-gp56 family major capsid protein